MALGGKVVVVTGGATGIGRAYCDVIGAAGGKVVIADLDAEAAEAAAAELVETGTEAMGVKVDIASVDDTLALSDRVRERFGEVHGLVNNAALMSALPRRSWTEIPLEEWDLVMTVNLRGLFLTCRSIVPLMTSGGSVVNISSTRALDGTPNRLHYTTSKSGCLGFTRALAREVGAQGVRVNSVAPGITLSDNQVATSDPDYLDALAVGRALPRQQRPSDLTGAVVFLLSDASAFISGQTLVVDGGKVMN